MATVKLVEGRTYRIGGQVFHKGQEMKVPDDVAKALSKNSHFLVVGLEGMPSEFLDDKLQVEEYADRIGEAVERLDKRKKDHYKDGKPLASAVSIVLNLRVTDKQVEDALDYLSRRTIPKSRPKKTPMLVAEEAERKPVSFVIKKPEPVQTAPAPVETALKEQTPEHDPTTEGALNP